MSRFVDSYMPEIEPEKDMPAPPKIDTSQAVRSAVLPGHEGPGTIRELLNQVIKTHVDINTDVGTIVFHDPYLNVPSFQVQTAVGSHPDQFAEVLKNWMYVTMKKAAGRVF